MSKPLLSKMCSLDGTEYIESLFQILVDVY